MPWGAPGGVQGYDFRTKPWRVDEATATQAIYDHQLLDRSLVQRENTRDVLPAKAETYQVIFAGVSLH